MDRKSLWIMTLALEAFSVSLFGMEIVAHRGASYDAPENTLAAMKLAWEQKADAIETDIHLSKDGKIVVIHDADTKRVGARESKVVEQTWSELQQLDVGKWKDPKFSGEKIPTLESLLETIPEGKGIFIEIKTKELAILPKLGEAMQASGKQPEQLRLITFHYEVAVAAKKRFPKNPVYFLHDWKQDKQTGQFPNVDALIRQALDGKLDGLDLNYRFPIDKKFVEKVHQAGLQLFTWTVDDTEIAKLELEAGVDGVTTNRPEFLRAALPAK